MTDAWLDGLWYLAATSRELKKGALMRRDLFGQAILLGRTKSGEVFALKDACPHRGAPLSAGRMIDCAGAAAVECPYHGWAFRAADGACAAIPALAEGAPPETIRVRRFPVHEANGLVWLHHGDGDPETAPPDIGVAATMRPRTVTVVEAAGPYDEAVLGLVDAAHTPVVHKQWWWRDGAARKVKEKNYEPTELGFRMPPHAPSSNSRIYRIFGGAPTTEIEFRLPGLRLEHIRAGKTHVLGLTTMTPMAEYRTRIVHCIFWNSAALALLTPIVQDMSDSFLGQDGRMLRLQGENLAREAHRALYYGDADEPAKWYFSLKRAWAGRRDAGGFTNPVAPARLRWRT